MSLGDLSGRRVVDLFAGSGALGIEALSRGAAFVDFVDADRNARETLERNLATLGAAERARIWPLTLPRGLSRLGAQLKGADLVLADPPYGGADARAVLDVLGRPDVLQEGCRVVVERHQKDEVHGEAGTLVLARERRYGETVLEFYEAGPSGPAEAGRHEPPEAGVP